MKKKCIGALGAGIAAVLLMTTCGLAPLADYGTLVLNVSSQPLLTVKTIVPGLDMEPAYYDVYGTGPGGAAFEQLGLRGNSTAQL